MWYGLFGAPLAWTTQHVTGFFLTDARCGAIGRGGGLSLDAWTIAVGATAAVLAAGAVVASVLAWRMTRDHDDEPPTERVHFMATMGLLIAPLCLTIVLMSSLGSVLLPTCVQS